MPEPEFYSVEFATLTQDREVKWERAGFFSQSEFTLGIRALTAARVFASELRKLHTQVRMTNGKGKVVA